MRIIGFIHRNSTFCALCEPVGVKIYIYSSDKYDVPIHCNKCDVLIPVLMTSDGLSYICESLDRWATHRQGNYKVLRQWWNEYQVSLPCQKLKPKP